MAKLRNSRGSIITAVASVLYIIALGVIQYHSQIALDTLPQAAELATFISCISGFVVVGWMMMGYWHDI